MANVFFSYSHVDEALRDRLEVHLSLLKQQGLIETWHDRRILAGDDIDAAIDYNLETADIILLLVSADFIASRYCYSVEMKRALARHMDGTARVVAVILDACDWQSAPFGTLLALPTDGKPVTAWANQAQAWLDVARQIRLLIGEPTQARIASAAQTPRSADHDGRESLIGNASECNVHALRGNRADVMSPRSSNLRVKKQFSDFDRDEFINNAFEYMAKFFNASLSELSARNEDIQIRFDRVNAKSFTAIAYCGGRTVAECSVRIGNDFGGRSSSLSFSYGANAAFGSSNEIITVESDSQSIFLKPLGMQFRGGERDAQLSEQGASEHLWALFIESLQ